METQIQRNALQGSIQNYDKKEDAVAPFLSKDLKALAHQMDIDDPLRQYRDLFHIPKVSGKEAVYFSGHSLGLQPKSTKSFIAKELDRWANFGVEGHFLGENPWVTFDEICVESMANIVGAKASEVVLMNSLTVNLHLMLTSFYRPTKSRNKIIVESCAFPSDMIAVTSHIKHHGYDPSTTLLVLKPRDPSDKLIRESDILEQIAQHGDEIALVFLGGVNYYTGQAYDLEKITRVGQSHGCIVGFDLAHAAGNIHLELNKWGVDFAVWCTYKYLNSGPGGIGGCFVNSRHGNNFRMPRLSGWWSHDKETRFLMRPELNLAEGASGFQLSNPSIFCLAALRGSLELYDKVGMEAFLIKSRRLTGYLATLLEQIQTGKEKQFQIITPKEPERRGCQLSLIFSSSPRTVLELLNTEHAVIVDFREPDCIRVAPNPFYNSFYDIYKFVKALEQILKLEH